MRQATIVIMLDDENDTIKTNIHKANISAYELLGSLEVVKDTLLKRMNKEQKEDKDGSSKKV